MSFTQHFSAESTAASDRLHSPFRGRWGSADGRFTLRRVIARYSRPAMAAIWSDEGKLESWLEVELAATAAWSELGVVPPDAAEALLAGAKAPSPERVAELEATLHHDTAAFVDAVAEQLGPEHGDAGRWFHYGLTSSDVVDTALALQVRQAGELILDGIDRAFAAVVARAEQHRTTLQMGRTHGVHAEPTTFGLKLAGWAFELDRGRRRIARALDGIRVGKLSGAVGTYAATDPELERIACERLGLEPAPSSTQILQRDRHAELLSALAVVASSLDKFALEIRHLARTEVAEVQEPFGKGQKGSSAMPHKRNPVVAERICGLARVLRGAALVGLENVALWHERDISHSSAERVVIPDAFLALDYMLDRFAWLVDGLVVREQRMLRNVEASHYLFFSQRVLLALVESGLSRDDAYRLVQRNAMRAWDEELDFRELCRVDDEIASRIDLDAVFDVGAYTRHVDTIFARLQSLAPREEALHV
jgi:adenylosuccinate lyase